MMPEAWQRIEAIVEGALDRDPSARAAYLDEACGDDQDLRREVESLLSFEKDAERAVAGAVKDAKVAFSGAQLDFTEGERIGVYRILRQIGKGGMGTVYLAERDDDEFRKRVAIKLVTRGMDTVALLARFRHERQILANLDHPYIARLMDGGSTPDGQPYLVMEYVDGQPIHVFCRERNLDVKERLRLFLRVCEAVACAHRSRVIHRDLKPQNILVTAEGVPKLLDFGVAKLLAPDSSGFTLTAFPGARPLTPEYASPEQVRGLIVTPVSDVYALGAVLYELLTGTRAQKITTTTEIERVVCETAVPRPSSVAPTPSLARQIQGDLDNIILMAMRKEPERRYQSVELLAEDIEHHLGARAVMARQDTLFYRAGKYVLRNRLGIMAAAAVLISVVTVGMVTLRRDTGGQGPILTRFTFDSAMTMEPDVSPDGKFVAYVSDRGGDPNFQLWVQPVGGGEARKLTRSSADHRYPRFSPDGSLIAYYVERTSSPGIYVIPVTGGEPRKIVDEAAYPRFSPDGTSIACLLGVGTRFDTGRSIAVVPLSGGPLREISTGLLSVSSPIWSPDGSRLLFRGASAAYPQSEQSFSWYLVPAAGGKRETVDVEDALRKGGMQFPRGLLPEPYCWYKGRVLFTGEIGDSKNLWQIALSPSTYRVDGVAKRVTFGTEADADASVGGDRLVAFAGYTTEQSLYVLPRKTPSGAGQSEMRRMTSRPGDYYGIGITLDRRHLLYAEGHGGRRRIVIRDLDSGSERELSFLASEDFSAVPILSPDGSRIVYERHLRAGGRDRAETVLRSVDGAPTEVLCQDCGIPRVWFPDGRHLIAQPIVPPSQNDPGQLGARRVNIATKEVSQLAVPPGRTLSVMSFSADGRWAVIRMTPLPAGSTGANELFLAPLRQYDLAPLTEWIPLPSRTPLSWVQWSEDGSDLYFFGDSATEYSLEVLPLDPLTKITRGPRRILYRFDRPPLKVVERSGLVVGAEGLIFSAIEAKGNIWMVHLP